MFSRIYTLGVGCYGAAIAIASKFSEKAKLRHVGAQEAFDTLESEIDKQENYIWFHAASLGEFEQGRPVIEKLLKQYPEKKIVLTFFSPSGYEVRKNYSGADVICYLPLDKPLLVNRFLDIVNPEMAVFIKYEFWANYLKALHKREIPTYIISAIFRPNQVFFKWYGKGFLNILNCFTKIYVQDTNSLQLLSKFGINHVEVVGDTRFDRVAQIANQAKELPIVKAFATDNDILVAGSTWEADEQLLARYIGANKEKKLILVPHEVTPEHIIEICNKMRCSYVLYTQATEEEAAKAKCLIVDTIGILSSIYQYGKVAYIGGGFGVGIHNTLEAAVWGMPVVFGPNYSKFKEARDLIELGGGFSINSYRQLEDLVNALFIDSKPGEVTKDYVMRQKGATEKIINQLFNY